ncbi:hypothetical protein C8R45DRAFT_830520 [Mycena sanguinolenta]|nr:hypothetical protein C8R45DRAFT_830520 [Mycena sanguinolenta]
MPLQVEHAVLDFIFEKHYNITDNAEWATLLPPHNGRVRVGILEQEFNVGMFSDLGCLENIRRAFLLLREGTRDPLLEVGAEACLGQMRQAIMCNSDLTLEPAYLVCNAEDKCAPAATGDHVAHRCRNWVQVRQFVQNNQLSWNRY